MKPHAFTRSSARGFSLVEMMVTVMVTAAGLLGLASLQVNSIKYAKTANSRSVSSQLAYDLSDRMRSNLTGFKAGLYALNKGNPPPAQNCISRNCSPAEIAAADLNDWQAQVSRALPNGDAEVKVIPGGMANAVRITIGYREIPATQGEDNILNSAIGVTNCVAPFSTDNQMRCFVLDVMP